MNIVFFTQEDPFYVKIFFDEFFQQYERLEEIKAFVISRPMGRKSTKKLVKQMYDFYGPFDFLKIGMQYTYKKAMGKRNVSRRGTEKVTTYTVRQLAASYGLNVLERSDLNNPKFHEIIKQYKPDIFISVASPIIFKEQLINIPKLDTINIHNAPLPNYRGMLPNFWQLYHDEKQAGMTIHRINTGIDTGDMLLQHFTPIESIDSLHDLIVKTKKAGVSQMIKVIEDFRAGTTTYTKIEGTGSYFTFPTREDVLEFKKRGKNLL
ncbi:methionyl-tRNA formyltransferase [Desulfopila sp. IMCC35008]|uniref:methionyl-tRNA formyltransferase n=1 Tax=Desulfopila sp. IMCC35008 TaxID=2653858 RepID=UPI0013D82BB9|nr:formyl transferase [Desulfopila sp. IMCC35008]